MNKIHTLVAAASAAIALFISAPAAAQTTLAPEDAVAAALAKNPELVIEQHLLKQAELGFTAEDNRYVPILTSEAGYRIGSTPQLSQQGTRTISIDSFVASTSLSYLLPIGTQISASLDFGRSVRDSVVLGDLGSAYDTSVGVEVRQPLLRGFGVHIGLAQLDIARNEVSAARISQDAARLDMTTRVLQAYWNLWSAQRALKIQHDALAIARKQLADGEVRLEAGAMAPAELTSLRAEIARAQESVLEADATIVQRANTLALLIGEQPGSVLMTMEQAPQTSASIKLDEALLVAEKNSPTLATLLLELETLSTRVEIADNNARADLQLIGSIQSTGLGFGAGEALGNIASSQLYYGGVRLELPLQNKARLADADRATASIEVTRARYAAARRELRAEVAQAVATLTAATQRLGLARESAVLARESVDAQSARFDAGRATSLDVVNSLQAQREAEFRVVSLEVEIVQQKLTLEQLMRGVSSTPAL
jgi:outer membrane protein TolC